VVQNSKYSSGQATENSVVIHAKTNIMLSYVVEKIRLKLAWNVARCLKEDKNGTVVKSADIKLKSKGKC
jgi:hypothetical protein